MTGYTKLYKENLPVVMDTTTEEGRKAYRAATRRIVAAANMVIYRDRTGEVKRVVIVGARHFDNLMHGQYRAIFGDDHPREQNEISSEQGFVDQYGEFHDRTEAFKIALLQNQLIRDESWNNSTSKNPTLYSENLY